MGWDEPDDMDCTTVTCWLALGRLLGKTCLFVLGLLLPVLLVSTLGCSQKQGIMLAKLSEDPILLFLCLKAISSAGFEVEKVA